MLTDSESQHVASELRSRRLSSSKRDRKSNLQSSKPLSFSPSKKPDNKVSNSNESRRVALQQTLEVLKLLPANSTYAKHRQAIVRKALEILDAER